MKIRIRNEDHSFSVAIPTGLIFSKPSVWLYLKLAGKYSSRMEQYIPEDAEKQVDNFLTKLPEEEVYALCNEIRRIKKKHGSWELVKVCSVDGTQVSITL